MAKIPQNAQMIDILLAKRKSDIKKISTELYSKRMESNIKSVSGGVILQVHFKNLVQAIKITSKFIEENNLEVDLCNQKYWATHACEFYNARNKNLGI